jgi:hypothetical protein
MPTIALQTLLHPEFLRMAFQFLALGKDASRDSLSWLTFGRDARVAPGRCRWMVCSEHDPSMDAQSKPRCELSCDQVIIVAWSGGFVLKAVLNLQLNM